MGEHMLPRDITVYQAVQQFRGQVHPPLPPRNISVSMTKTVTVYLDRVADLHHFNADPAFHFNVDPDPDPHQRDANLQPLIDNTRSPF